MTQALLASRILEAPDLHLSRWAWDGLVCRRSRYKVIRGGRGSGKSWQIARALLLMASKVRLKILCAREFQLSVSDSVHALLCEQIRLMGLGGWVKDKTRIYHRTTGSEFLFAGLWQNVEKIQSMEGINICWVEEAQRVSDHSWKVLIPTIRTSPLAEWPQLWQKSEMWISFNPVQEDDPTALRFIKSPPPDTLSFVVNWQDNPWLPIELRDEAEHLRRTDPEEYYHVWEGQFWARADAQVFNKKWSVEPFTAGPDWIGPFYGIDFGFSTTPLCVGKQWIHDDVLYVERSDGGLRIETVDIPAYMNAVAGSQDAAKEAQWRADSARPETISALCNAGYNVVGADKWQGSVEDGVSFLRSFNKIVIHPRAAMAEKQVRLYRYKVDKQGNILKEIEKRNDDWSDQCRYAIEPIIKGKFGSMADVV